MLATTLDSTRASNRVTQVQCNGRKGEIEWRGRDAQFLDDDAWLVAGYRIHGFCVMNNLEGVNPAVLLTCIVAF